MKSARALSDADSALFNGTSGAAPIAAGVAALVRQRYPVYSVTSVKFTILSGASAGVVSNTATSPNLLLFSRP